MTSSGTGEASHSGQLDGRRALVTGGSRKLGASIARSLAARGAQVAVTYFGSEASAGGLVAQLSALNGLDHFAIRADLTDPEVVTSCCVHAVDVMGGMEILVNNFGPFSAVPVHQLPLQEWRRVWGGNVEAAYLATSALVPSMRRVGWGRVINVSAGSAYLRNHSIYGLAKDAIGTLTELLSVELGPEITVNAVAPGQILESEADIDAVDPSFVARAVARTPAGRLVTREEVSEVIALLCSAAFDMLTGAVLPLDGGWRFNRF
jgi:NAD(P)-dependent dehydrogenase (short-subunit alcohol dehydrogenase family)